MAKVRIVISDVEVYPEYRIKPVDPEILAEHPNAGVEVDQELIDEYERARDAWDAVQDKLSALDGKG